MDIIIRNSTYIVLKISREAQSYIRWWLFSRCWNYILSILASNNQNNFLAFYLYIMDAEHKENKDNEKQFICIDFRCDSTNRLFKAKNDSHPHKTHDHQLYSEF